MIRQEPSRPRNKAQHAYATIRERIESREYSPGYRLVLSRIAADLDMSVVPVREALRQLEAEDLVNFEPNVGAHVSMVDDTQYRHSMQTLAILEGAATALAVRQMTPKDMAAARVINEDMQRSLTDFNPHSFTKLNQQFHTMLFDRCINPRMLELVRSEWARLGGLRDSTFAFIPGRARDSVAEHEHILKLIESRAPLTAIEDAVRRHRRATLDTYLDHKREPSPTIDQLA